MTHHRLAAEESLADNWLVETARKPFGEGRPSCEDAQAGAGDATRAARIELQPR